jgi:hypothetical protein
MKRQAETQLRNSLDMMAGELLMHLELGDQFGKKGHQQRAIDHYIKGLQIAREIEDKPRIQQFSNLILTYL